jgi:integrase
MLELEVSPNSTCKLSNPPPIILPSAATGTRPLTTPMLSFTTAELKELDKDALVSVVSLLLRKSHAEFPAVPLSRARDEFLTAKRQRRLRDRTIADYTSRLNRLVDFNQSLVSEISREHLEPLVHVDGQAAHTANGNRRVFYTFFQWCRRKKYRADNPVEDIERSRVEDCDIKVLTVEETRAVLTAAKVAKQGRMVPYLALALFAGLRPKELARLDWSSIDFDQKLIRVGSEVAKKRRRRVIEISDNLVAWLRTVDRKRWPICGSNHRKNLDRVRIMAGFKISYKVTPNRLKKFSLGRRLKEWPEDVLRHTALSYHYGRTQDERTTAYWAGNSPDMLHRHYKGLVTPQEVADFWNISP